MKLIWFIRSVIFALGQGISLILFSAVGQLTRPFNFKVRYIFMHYWACFCLVWLRWICGVSYKVHGLENIQVEKSSLILARHESAWETLAFQKIFPRQAFVLKRELLKIPFFGWGLALLSPIALDRGAGRKALNQLVSEGKSRLEQGDWVVIFPEGTRMPIGQIGKINIGGATLATKIDFPVHLVAHNSGKYWPKNSFIKYPGVIQIHISPALVLTGLSVSEINQQVEAWFVKYLEMPTVV